MVWCCDLFGFLVNLLFYSLLCVSVCDHCGVLLLLKSLAVFLRCTTEARKYVSENRKTMVRPIFTVMLYIIFSPLLL